MTARWFTPARAALALLLLAACTSQAETGEETKATLEAANAAYDAAILAQDRAALEALYSERYRYLAEDGAMRGRTEKIAFLTDPANRLSDAQSEEIEVEVFTDAALVTGQFSGGYMADGREARFREHFTTVWVQEDGAWRLRYEHVSPLPDTP